MRLTEIALEKSIEERTRNFVAESDEFINHALGPAVEKMAKGVRKLKGAEGLLLRKYFGDADAVWKKFLWYRIAEHHFEEARPLEEAIRLAEQDLLALDALRHPM